MDLFVPYCFFVSGESYIIFVLKILQISFQNVSDCCIQPKK